MAETKKSTTKATTVPATEATPAMTNDGRVHILYIDSVMTGNQIRIGAGCRLNGSGRLFTRTIEEFEGEFMTPLAQKLIEERKFIILSGLTDEQRELYGCRYDPGEVITTEATFLRILSRGTEFACEVFAKLCKEHREMVATRIIAAHEAGDKRVTFELVKALHTIAAPDYKDGMSPLSELVTKLALV